MSKTLKNTLFLILSTLVGIGMMVWLYRGFDFSALSVFFSQPRHYLWIGLVLIAGISANVLRAMRWRMLLHSADIRISQRRAIELIFITYLINSVTPRLGELARSLLVKRGNADVSTRALGTVVVEKAADVGFLILVIGLAVSLRWTKTVELVSSLSDRLTFALPGYLFYIMVGSGVCLLVGLSFPLWKYVRHFFLNLWQGMASIARLRSPLSFVVLCTGIWACNFLQLYLLIPCYDLAKSVGVADMIHVFAAASVGVLLPTPGGAGPWHYAVVKTLTKVYGVARTTAQSLALISHGLKTVLVLLLGCLGYASYYRSVWKSVQRKRKRSNQ